MKTQTGKEDAVGQSLSTEGLERDAARWRKAVQDGEFPTKRNGEWMHVCRITGKILFSDTADGVMDKAIREVSNMELARMPRSGSPVSEANES